jgi:hypothetical protein
VRCAHEEKETENRRKQIEIGDRDRERKTEGERGEMEKGRRETKERNGEPVRGCRNKQPFLLRESWA